MMANGTVTRWKGEVSFTISLESWHMMGSGSMTNSQEEAPSITKCLINCLNLSTIGILMKFSSFGLNTKVFY